MGSVNFQTGKALILKEICCWSYIMAGLLPQILLYACCLGGICTTCLPTHTHAHTDTIIHKCDLDHCYGVHCM